MNNSLGNKWFDFNIPFKNIYTIIPFLACFLTRYLKFIILMFWPKAGHLVYNSTNFPSLLIIFPSVFHRTWLGLPHPSIVGILWCMCTHPIDIMGIHLFTLHSRQRTHGNLWCSSWHLCYHCARCWLPHGKGTITCVFFNHVQFILLTSRHCGHQRWHLHCNQCCHCWPNTNEFVFPILHNWKIYCLRCNSS